MRAKLFFAISLSWLLFLAFMDFVAAPTIIQSEIPLFSAGEIAGSLFIKFNYVEVLLALVLLVCVQRVEYFRYELIVALILLAIPLVDIFYLSPKILYYAQLMQNPEVVGSPNEQHYQFHSAYFILEIVKIFGLSTLVVLNIIRDVKKDKSL